LIARAGLIALAAAWIATPLAAQEGDPAPPPPAATAAELYAEWDEVEVYDVDNDMWDPCIVRAAYKGAYRVTCNYEQTIRRDIHVRRVGGEAVGQTAAQPVTGAPFKRGDLVLASIMSLPNDWRLCVVLRNEVTKNNSYLVDCGTEYRSLPQWTRKDPKAPQ
jgi:hypothetical protein